MAFSQTNAQRELANRKILEELQLKKQLLLKQGTVPNLNSPSTPILPLVPSTVGTIPFTSAPASTILSEAHTNTPQRAALHSAHSQSFGFFVTQDSSFGNLILPVVPRFEPNK